MIQRTLKFPFSNSRGQQLAGLIDMPQGEPLFFGIFAPCFTCTKESHAAHKICRALSRCGIAMLRFDMTGLGESEGSFADTNFSTRTLDIVAAGKALAEIHQAPKLLIGHSISGTAALAAAAHLPSLQALATLGAPADPAHVIAELRRHNLIIIKDDTAEMTIAGRKITVKRQMADNMESSSVEKETATVMTAENNKLFIFHAPHDEIVSFRNAQVISDRALGNKEIIPLGESATHLLERGHDDADLISEALRSWFNLHLQA
jgi:alpha/beta superfamily hydrolase